MKKRYFFCYYASFVSCLLFGIALKNDIIPLMVITAILCGVCIVWFAKVMESGEKWSYTQIRKHSGKLNAHEKEIQEIKETLNGKADKMMNVNFKENVHPGSHPSIEYQKMVVEREIEDDVRDKVKESSV